jgi:hypothetical protein
MNYANNPSKSITLGICRAWPASGVSSSVLPLFSPLAGFHVQTWQFTLTVNFFVVFSLYMELNI